MLSSISLSVLQLPVQTPCRFYQIAHCHHIIRAYFFVYGFIMLTPYTRTHRRLNVILVQPELEYTLLVKNYLLLVANVQPYVASISHSINSLASKHEKNNTTLSKIWCCTKNYGFSGRLSLLGLI